MPQPSSNSAQFVTEYIRSQTQLTTAHLSLTSLRSGICDILQAIQYYNRDFTRQISALTMLILACSAVKRHAWMQSFFEGACDPFKAFTYPAIISSVGLPIPIHCCRNAS